MSKSKKRYNFENKKSIHTTMSLGTHSEFRIKLLRKGLSMQEVLEECAIRIAGQDNYMDKMLNELVERKITGERKIAESDAQSLYRLIEAEDEDE
tara:strand:+ start:19842 stop:20126 length:285 start_codon:yes stop_codon:yes gene_type:complete